MTSTAFQRNYFAIIAIILCGCYLGFELFFNAYVMLGVDDFWFSHSIYQYKSKLPYLDFSPYKSVLGYYILSLPMLIDDNSLHTLVFTKNAIAVLNATLLFLSSWWLTRFFPKYAVLMSLAMLICSESLLTYSTDIRVDLLCYWFCLFSVLSLLESRYLLAGCLLGLAFATSQKALWYIVASNVALGACWIFYSRDLKSLFKIINFNMAAVAVIGAYLGIWSWVAGSHTVINNVFFDAAAMYQLDFYDNMRKLFWHTILTFNPLWLLLCPLALISLFVTCVGDALYQRRTFIIFYAYTIMFCIIPYKQIFPYYIQVTLPAFLLLYAAFFSWMLAIFKPNTQLVIMARRWLFFYLTAYIVFIIGCQVFFYLPRIYLLIAVIPVSFIGYFYYEAYNDAELTLTFRNLVLATCIIVGAVYPLCCYFVFLPEINGDYQRFNVNVVRSLLADGGDYVAGVDLLYNQSQPIPGMKHLMMPAIAYLIQPTSELRKVMLTSLNEDPEATVDSVISALESSNVKLYVNNYRMEKIPKRIQTYLAAQYQHFWGSIYLYSPQVLSGVYNINLKFSGRYRIEAATAGSIKLNGKTYQTQKIVALEKGNYQSSSTHDYRLRLIPAIELPVDAQQYKMDQWQLLTR